MTLIALALYSRSVSFCGIRASFLTPAKLTKVFGVFVTGAFAKPLFLGSIGKAQLEHAEDYHEHWWS